MNTKTRLTDKQIATTVVHRVGNYLSLETGAVIPSIDSMVEEASDIQLSPDRHQRICDRILYAMRERKVK